MNMAIMTIMIMSVIIKNIVEAIVKKEILII